MKHLNRKKTVLLLAMVVLILAGAVGGTLAYIVTSSGPVQNTFTPAHVTCAVEESDFVDGTSTIKNNVTIRNTGNTSAYIRAAVVANWCDASSKILAPQPVTLERPILGDGWSRNTTDGYYYYSSSVPAGGSTGALITGSGYTPRDRPAGVPADAHLEMTIVCQAVQAEGLGSGVTDAQSAFQYVAKHNPGTGN